MIETRLHFWSCKDPNPVKCFHFSLSLSVLIIGLLRDEVAEDPRQRHASEEDTLHPPLEQAVSGLRLGRQVQIDGFVHLPPPISDNININPAGREETT